MRAEESAAQVAPPQQSVGFLHSSPRPKHFGIIFGAGMSPHRPTPGGSILQVPAQHSPFEAQRSCDGRQPVAQAHRSAPSGDGSQRPEQQSMSDLQISRAGWHPGSGWQVAPPGPPH
jgi:hypothetical protein